MTSEPLRLSVWSLGSLIVPILLSTGCGHSGPDVEMVGGLVSLDGKPLADATVIFAPIEDAGLTAVGRTDSDGRFRLSARKGTRYGQGTVVGEYRVVMSKLETFDEPESPPDQPPDEYVEPKELLPKLYTSETTTPFRATVVKGTNEFTFALESNGH